MSCAEKKPHPPSGGNCPRTFDKYLGSFSPHTRFLCSAHSEEVRESITLWFISGSSGYTTSPVSVGRSEHEIVNLLTSLSNRASSKYFLNSFVGEGSSGFPQKIPLACAPVSTASAAVKSPRLTPPASSTNTKVRPNWDLVP